MNSFSILLFIILFVGCGSPVEKQKNIISDETSEEKEISIEEPVIPPGAITANFNGDNVPFYGYVKNIDSEKAITTIAFQNKQLPTISIPKSYGAVLDTLKMKGMDRDILLANVKLKDTNFNKYFIYRLRNNEWKPLVNGFAIHKSNRPDTLRTISIDPKDSTKVIRYYSVFDLDKGSETGYTWRLLQETIPIENE